MKSNALVEKDKSPKENPYVARLKSKDNTNFLMNVMNRIVHGTH